MAIDMLLSGDNSGFPHPAYAIGLATAWVFDEVFDTRPIDFATEGTWQLPDSQEPRQEALEYLVSLLDSTDDAD